MKQALKKQKRSISSLTANQSIPEGEFKKVAISDIDPSPFNYRKVFPEKKMAELAASIALHGILENLNLRKTPSGRYELVSGERRFRAAKMAGLTEVPAIIKDLTDDQVKEIQLTENLQREDPHPLEEAEAIGQLQYRYKTMDEIAARLGKSKTFIYGRLRLLTLIPDLREMFIAEIFTLKQVLEIAALSPESQQEFYNEDCENWKDEHFEAPDIPYALSQFTDDLTRAPFDIKDKTLIPDRGACSKCPYNTATLKTLFPEEAKEAICKDSACFRRKCSAHFSAAIRKALTEHQPAALLFCGSPSASVQAMIKELPAAASLPHYNYHSVSVISEPERPDREDFEEEDDPDDQGYKQAMEEYQSDLDEYHHSLQSGNLIKGLLIMDGKVEICLFNERTARAAGAINPTVTAAEVQTAIRAGTATPDLLRSEMSRISTRETRSKELDKEKLQLKIHEQFGAFMGDKNSIHNLTAADTVAARFLLLESLGYSDRETILSRLGRDTKQSNEADTAIDQVENLFELLRNLSDEQYCFLIRTALSTRTETKFPSSRSAYFLTRMAGDAGVDIGSLEQEQQKKIESRQKSKADRIKVLEKKIAQLETA